MLFIVFKMVETTFSNFREGFVTDFFQSTKSLPMKLQNVNIDNGPHVLYTFLQTTGAISFKFKFCNHTVWNGQLASM